MRRASYTPLPTQAPPEPLIVVEESGNTDDEGGGDEGGGAAGQPGDDSRPASPGCDSPLLNPWLLSPYRDMRKRSLPTPACTSGITASQVRRLSEHGVGTEGAAAREAAFLATLQQAPTPAPGGRRHSVVTISRAPPTSVLFGRGRRESIAAFPSGAPRVLPPRRDSMSAVPPRPPATSGATSGSTHNLQLDIMDDIAEIKAARKVRLKMWRTPSRERVCEVQPLEGPSGAASPSAAAGAPAAQPTRYQSRGAAEAGALSRRYSDFVSASGAASASGASLAPGGGAGAVQRRRASEQPPSVVVAAAAAAAGVAGPSGQQGKGRGAGIVCTNSDLISILSSLASSAQEIHRVGEGDDDALAEEAGEDEGAAAAPAAAPAPAAQESPQKKKAPPASPSTGAAASAGSAEQKRSRLRSLRSNSFDVSMLLGAAAKDKDKDKDKDKQGQTSHTRSGSVGPASWFIKRHQPKKALSDAGAKGPGAVAFRDDKAAAAAPGASGAAGGGGGGGGGGGALAVDHKVVWDGRSGSVVDAQVLGSAIEDFLARRGSGNDSPGPSSPAPTAPGAAAAPGPPGAAKTSPSKAPAPAAAAAAASAPAAGAGGKGSWFAGAANKEDEEATGSDTCDNSICSTLKDLFVK